MIPSNIKNGVTISNVTGTYKPTLSTQDIVNSEMIPTNLMQGTGVTVSFRSFCVSQGTNAAGTGYWEYWGKTSGGTWTLLNSGNWPCGNQSESHIERSISFDVVNNPYVSFKSNIWFSSTNWSHQRTVISCAN